MLIIKKEVQERIDLVIIPDSVFHTFMDVHVHRDIRKREYRRGTTVIVAYGNLGWTEIPENKDVVGFFIKAIERNKIEERRTFPIPIPHTLIKSFRVRMVDDTGYFITPPKEGNFVLSVRRIQSAKDLVWYHPGPLERHKIKRSMQKSRETGGLFFVVEHLHVEAR
ncbi:hypothetical protein HYS48_00840 [Candidatus Woesearchaeota archaeon]|nr:hypothetical protein [Candidatus Woesearchaeota archaeon]